MRRFLAFFLPAILALGLWTADHSSVAVAIGSEISVRLSEQEADCIVGGDAGCLDVAAGSYGGCVEKNFDPERPETSAAFIECGAVGLWSGIVCAVNWLWDLIF